MPRTFLRSLIVALPLWLPVSARAASPSGGVIGIARPWQLGFQDAASPVMEKLVWLHDTLLMSIITFITLLVLALTAFIALRFNRRANPTPSTFTHNTQLEVIWTVIPILILMVIGVFSMRAHYYMETEPEGGITLKVVGHQWYWSYEYPDYAGVAFDSYIVKDADLKPGQPRLLTVDNEVVVPVNTVVHVHTTGADVIHSWAVPAFGLKRDAVPGRLNDTWFEANKLGTFYGQCSELCGVGHGFMPIVVRVVPQGEFDAWIAAKQKAAGVTPGTKGAAESPPAADVNPNPPPATKSTPEVPTPAQEKPQPQNKGPQAKDSQAKAKAPKAAEKDTE